MNKLLLKGAGVLGVVTVLALGVAITKNYMIDPATSLATPPSTASQTQYKTKIGCMDMKACNYDKTATTDNGATCNYAQYRAESRYVGPGPAPFPIVLPPDTYLSYEPNNLPETTPECDISDPKCVVYPLYIDTWSVSHPSEFKSKVKSQQIGFLNDRAVAVGISGLNACRDNRIKKAK